MSDLGGINIFQEPLKIYCKLLPRKDICTMGSSTSQETFTLSHRPHTGQSLITKKFSSQIASRRFRSRYCCLTPQICFCLSSNIPTRNPARPPEMNLAFIFRSWKNIQLLRSQARPAITSSGAFLFRRSWSPCNIPLKMNELEDEISLLNGPFFEGPFVNFKGGKSSLRKKKRKTPSPIDMEKGAGE